ncbi:MAG TPA: tRNA (cytidine(34)-2'-O)-methyltransferase [Burkholderiales bacterium]
MFEIVLCEPEIPQNAGNIVRLCANTGARLHLVRPLGFRLEHRGLRRAGLDYHDLASVAVHRDWAACREALGEARLFALTTRGGLRHDQPAYGPGDAFVFGPESRGLPEDLLESLPTGQRLRIPMRAGSRSLNLANAVAVVVYEAWRQQAYAGG